VVAIGWSLLTVACVCVGTYISSFAFTQAWFVWKCSYLTNVYVRKIYLMHIIHICLLVLMYYQTSKLKILDEKLVSGLNFNKYIWPSITRSKTRTWIQDHANCVRHFRFFKFYPKLLTQIRLILVIAFFTCTNCMISMWKNIKK